MKRITLFALFLFSSNIYAYNSPFQGPYLNLGIGGTNTGFDISQQIQVSIPGTLNSSVPNSMKSYDNNFSGVAGLGYTQVMNSNFALGIEATANIENTSTSESLSTHETLNGFTLYNNIQAKLKNSFALLIKPGYIVNQNTLIYALVGPRWGNFETSTETKQSFVTFKSNIPTTSRSGYKVGLTAGAGIEQYLGNNFSFSLEYAYTDYGNIPTPGTLTAPIANSTGGVLTNDTHSISARTNTVMFNLLYRVS